jgi:uncharacterized phiE125 gp8 family phage protein
MFIHSSLTLITPPATEVITVQDVHDQDRITTTAEDSLLALYILAARRSIEAQSQRQFITATWQMTMDLFPRTMIRLQLPPLQTVNWIQYISMNGTVQTVDSSIYVVDTTSQPARIMPDYGKVWPVLRPIFNAVTINFTCGYGDNPTDVPQTYRTAIAMFAAELYKQREPTSETELHEVPIGIKRLLATEGWGSYT